MTVICSEAEYEAALVRVEVFFNMPEEPDPESADGKEFTALVDGIVAYEAIHYPIESPPAHEMLRYLMELNEKSNGIVDPYLKGMQSPERFESRAEALRWLIPLARKLFPNADTNPLQIEADQLDPVGLTSISKLSKEGSQRLLRHMAEDPQNPLARASLERGREVLKKMGKPR